MGSRRGGAARTAEIFHEAHALAGVALTRLPPLTKLGDLAIRFLVASRTGTNQRVVSIVIEHFMALAASELKKHGSFKIGVYLNLKHKKKPGRPRRSVVSVRVLKKFKLLLEE